MSSVHNVRKLGNIASHAEPINNRMALLCLRSLYDSVSQILKFLGLINSALPFSVDALTKKTTIVPEQPKKKYIIKVKKSAYTDSVKVPENSEKMKSSIDYTEAETRAAIIDMELREAHWNVCDVKGAIKASTACIETKLNIPASPDFPSGVGYADYVLFDEDGKALAVIEAKRACKDVVSGAKQAKIYAEALEKLYGVLPVIFYTNGYQIYMVNGKSPARRVFGYYTLEELHSLIVRRSLGEIEDKKVNTEISDRYFIQNACTSVCETYSAHKRKALCVMATGTGKTRFAIALTDILMRNNWIKSVLFLADRTELVTQAKKAFVKHLPNATLCAISETATEKRDYSANVIISTYQTMLNLIDTDERTFGIGRFDLIIIDECHRSCYNKYQAIFHYFDSLVLGLTATPKEAEGQDDTYSLFGLEVGNPTYNYAFETAVNEGFLVDYATINKTTKLLQSGAKYKELSDGEKKKYDEAFSEELELEEEQKIKLGKEFYSYIINIPTIDLVLQTLMNEGLRVDGGERLGKTIIFASDHTHAVKIVERFKELYKDKSDDYCQLIDYSVSKAGTIIDDFKEKDKEPIIAVSVDMLDTGIDVPEVLNLVFFKKVFSVIKFYQMIGRGTRVCKDFRVFSPAKSAFGKQDNDENQSNECQNFDEKQGFYIFDFCGNFDFFDVNPKGKITNNSLTLSQKIFELKLDMVKELQSAEHQNNEEHLKYYNKWKSELIATIKGLNRNLINVRHNLEKVEKYSDEKIWDFIDEQRVKEIKASITHLIESAPDTPSAKTFDAWLFNIELASFDEKNDCSKPLQKVTAIVSALLNKQTIPEIKEKSAELKSFLSSEYWDSTSISKLEKVRETVRELVKYLASEQQHTIETTFTDEVIEKTGTHIKPQVKDYGQRVVDYLKETTNCKAVDKIKNIEPLTQSDIKELEHLLFEELGTKAEYDKIAQNMPLGLFVRKIVGLNVDAVTKLLGEYQAKYNFNSAQQEFLHQIVTFVLQNGDIETSNLINDAPFCYQDFTELFDGNIEGVKSLMNQLHSVIAA